MNARVLVRFVLLVITAAAIVLPACNTMSGAGRDISNMGRSMENTAERNK